jgi:membrane-associated protein
VIDWVPCILHLDQCLSTLAQDYPTWVWAVLFLVIFAETGLVIFPFLPGDSLLFITGTIAATGAYSPHSMALILIAAAILGDTVNYFIGKRLGHHLTTEGSKWSRFIKPQYIKQTEDYFERYGMLALIIGRFAPIIRTFAPFLAGIAHMKYSTFLRYNIIGAILWVVPFIYAGYFFGQIPIVQQNLKWIMMAIIIISLLPIALQVLKAVRNTTTTTQK